MTTATAPAACAFFTFVANEASPRLISAMLPATAAGKSAAVAPSPQLTNVPVTLPSAEPFSGTAAMLVPLLVLMDEISPVLSRTVDRTSTPGPEMATSGPKFEKSATLRLALTAATATTPGYAAG